MQGLNLSVRTMNPSYQIHFLCPDCSVVLAASQNFAKIDHPVKKTSYRELHHEHGLAASPNK